MNSADYFEIDFQYFTDGADFDETDYVGPTGRRPEPLSVVRPGMHVTDLSGNFLKVLAVIGPVVRVGATSDFEEDDCLRVSDRLIGYLYPVNRPDVF